MYDFKKKKKKECDLEVFLKNYAIVGKVIVIHFKKCFSNE